MIKNVAVIFLALLCLVLSSYLTFDLNLPGISDPIPVTGQTFAVCVISILLPRSYGFIVMVSYLLLGAVGVPVFAEGASGLEHLTGRTSGYLWSFLLIPLIIGRSGSSTWHIGWTKPLAANVLGTIVILISGTLILGIQIGPASAFEFGFIPFIIPGILKSGWFEVFFKITKF